MNPKPIDASELECIGAGKTYRLPLYRIEDEGLIKVADYNNTIDVDETYQAYNVIRFCKGSKDDKSKFRQAGILMETLVTMQIHCLEALYNEVPSEDTKEAIEHFKKGLECLNRRTKDRIRRGVQQTYQS